jgi:hypothetical protein
VEPFVFDRHEVGAFLGAVQLQEKLFSSIGECQDTQGGQIGRIVDNGRYFTSGRFMKIAEVAKI